MRENPLDAGGLEGVPCQPSTKAPQREDESPGAGHLGREMTCADYYSPGGRCS